MQRGSGAKLEADGCACPATAARHRDSPEETPAPPLPPSAQSGRVRPQGGHDRVEQSRGMASQCPFVTAELQGRRPAQRMTKYADAREIKPSSVTLAPSLARRKKPTHVQTKSTTPVPQNDPLTSPPPAPDAHPDVSTIAPHQTPPPPVPTRSQKKINVSYSCAQTTTPLGQPLSKPNNFADLFFPPHRHQFNPRFRS